MAESELEIRSVSERRANRYGAKLLQDGNNTRELLERGANPNVLVAESGDVTPFMIALSEDKFDDARLMIEAGADVNYLVDDSVSLLMHYLRKNNIAASELLFIDGGAVIPETDDQLSSDLFYGMIGASRSVALTQELDDRGFDITRNFTCSTGDTTINFDLLSISILTGIFGNEKSSSGGIEFAQYLISKGIDINSNLIMESDGADYYSEISPLSLAIIEKNISMVEFLIEQGADLTSQIIIDMDSTRTIASPIAATLMFEADELLPTMLQNNAPTDGRVYTIVNGDTTNSLTLLAFAITTENIPVISELHKAETDFKQINKISNGSMALALTSLELIAISNIPEVSAIYSKELESIDINIIFQKLANVTLE